MATDIQIFNNPEFGEIRTAGTSEEPLFCLADICRVLDLHTGMTKQRLDQKGVSLIDTPTSGGVQQLVYINEKNLYKVIMRSDKPQAEPFQDWVCGEVLPSIRKTGSYSTRKEHTASLPLKDQLLWVKETGKMLKLNDASMLGMLQQIATPYGLPVPDYTPSHGILKSATELLKENGVNISVQDFNRLLVEKGYLVTLTRKSTSGKEKQFKSITDKGLTYGENQVNPKNPKSTQPLWYENRFLNLLSTVGLN